MALLLLKLLVDAKLLRHKHRLHRTEKLIEQLTTARQLAGLQQARLHSDVLACFFSAVCNGANTMANVQADIPQQSHPLLQPYLESALYDVSIGFGFGIEIAFSVRKQHQ